ncbi:hypothetical protein GGR57DRAFT_40244 [Xylariaceae sp. FL1272]|nr:hypothetical protein GGR57DRAFT_40244 [Xylariaceae sp. FL1272]
MAQARSLAMMPPNAPLPVSSPHALDIIAVSGQEGLQGQVGTLEPSQPVLDGDDTSVSAPGLPCSPTPNVSFRNGSPNAVHDGIREDGRAIGQREPRSGSFAGSPLRLPIAMISPAQVAFSAMQFLPIPLLILNDLKTAVLANEAMGTLLGFDEELSTTSARLKGQTLAQIGIDLLQEGRPIWISWESFLENLKTEMRSSHPIGTSPSSVANHHHSVPSLDSDAPSSGNYFGSSEKVAVDSAVDVVVTFKERHGTSVLKSRRSKYQTTAKMIISIWEVDDSETYYTLTFSNIDSPSSFNSESRISAARMSALEVADRKSIPASSTSSMGSSGGSSSTSIVLSPTSVSVSANPFPSITPPSRLPQTSTPSFLQKVTVIKDAVLNNTQMPILAMWIDGSAPVYNRAAKELFSLPVPTSITDGYDLLPNWEVWTDDFSRKLQPSEYPIAVLLREQKPFSGWRIGMYNPNTQKKVVYDMLGEVLTSDDTNEVVGGVVTCRDVTPMAEEITKIKEADEERFKLICDTMPQMVWTTTPDGLHDFFNNRWYDFTGLSPDESLGLGWKNPFHPDDMRATEKAWKHSLATGEPYFTEYRCLSKDGEWRWMIGRAMPLKNKDTGKIEKWFGTCTDVHETMEAKLAMKRTREQLLSVLTHAQTTIFSVDRDRKVTMLEGSLIWNDGSDTRSTDSESSQDSQKYIGRNVDEVFNDLNPRIRRGETPAFLNPVSDLLIGKPPNDTVQEHEIDGHFYRTRFSPITENRFKPGQSGRPVVEGVIGVVMNVTELKETEKVLKTQVREKRLHMANEAAAKEASRAAKEASRLKSQFLANMSHEIRTPITGVIGMAELLLDMPLGDEQREFALNISRSANALLTVINDILDFSKVESGRLDIEEVQFSLSMVVQDVSKMLSFAAERKNLDFRSDIAPDIENDLVVLGDPGRVRQIITNLITNSIKFTTTGSVEFSVWKEKETDDVLEAKFVIKDTGIGIDEDVRKRLFKPFSQGDPSTARKFGGTGLGLTISKNLLDLMRGRIELESSVGNGTTATCWIPFMKLPNPERGTLVEIGPIPDRLQSELSVSCTSSDQDYSGQQTGDSMHISPGKARRRNHLPSHIVSDNENLPMAERAKIQILVVEDNAINQQIALKTIKKLGFQVHAAWNGKEALDYIEAAQEAKLVKPDIILMDVQMPVIDGYKCTHILRHHRPYKSFAYDVPIVAMTASAIQGDREKCTRAGMDDYLAKPVNSKTLEKMLVRWSKSSRKNMSTISSHAPASECSESADYCGSPDIPTLRLHSEDKERLHMSDPSTDQQYSEDLRTANLLTPRPLVKSSPNDINSFPFGVTQSTRQLDSNELATQLRDDKLLDAAGVGTESVPPPPNALNEGDSLTKENVARFEKLDRQNSQGKVPRR